MTVGREQIRRFAAAVGERAACCHDVAAARAAGHPDLLAPPTFLVTLAAPAEDALLSRLGIATDGLLHRAQHFRHHRPVHAGDVLHATARLLGSGRALELETVLTTGDATPVSTVRSTLLRPSPGGTRP
ncbi:MaoC family dehydratase N-terminal domain-containing protein [Kitasatospora sp. NPDC093558]|uniref:FAS1-like dehydratase domain-containing protein n=1 Tax=Kitasatospora sp. NPDC093558 TaxID=3155201 RepID=UPI0034338846